MIPDLIKSKPLQNFKENTTEMLSKLKESGQPLVLTVDGKPEFVIQDIHAYQQLMRTNETKIAINSIQESVIDIQEGRTFPAEDVFNELMEKYDVPR